MLGEGMDALLNFGAACRNAGGKLVVKATRPVRSKATGKIIRRVAMKNMVRVSCRGAIKVVRGGTIKGISQTIVNKIIKMNKAKERISLAKLRRISGRAPPRITSRRRSTSGRRTRR